MNMMRIDIKVVLLGKEYSGKTSLVERFLSERLVVVVLAAHSQFPVRVVISGVRGGGRGLMVGALEGGVGGEEGW